MTTVADVLHITTIMNMIMIMITITIIIMLFIITGSTTGAAPQLHKFQAQGPVPIPCSGCEHVLVGH